MEGTSMHNTQKQLDVYETKISFGVGPYWLSVYGWKNSGGQKLDILATGDHVEFTNLVVKNQPPGKQYGTFAFRLLVNMESSVFVGSRGNRMPSSPFVGTQKNIGMIAAAHSSSSRSLTYVAADGNGDDDDGGVAAPGIFGKNGLAQQQPHQQPKHPLAIMAPESDQKGKVRKRGKGEMPKSIFFSKK